MRRRALIAVVAVGAICASAVAVGADAANPEADAPTTTVADGGSGAVDPDFDAFAYFTELFDRLDDDPRTVDELRSSLVPGSPADQFVAYLHGFDRAVRENSNALPRSRVRESRLDGIEVCVERFCTQYSGFVVDGDGMLESFDLNGVTIADRFGNPSKEIVVGPLTVRVVAAFQRVTADQLVVVLDLSPTDEAVTLALPDAVFHSPSGAAVPVVPEASAVPARLAAGQHGFVMVQFPDSDLGGELEFTFTTEESAEPTEVRVPVAPYVWPPNGDDR